MTILHKEKSGSFDNINSDNLKIHSIKKILAASQIISLM